MRRKVWSFEDNVTGEVWWRRSLPSLLWRVYAPRWAHRVGDFIWRLRESPKDYRYGGFRAWRAWVLKGESADYEP